MVLGKKSYLNKEELKRVSNYKIKNNLKLKGSFTHPFFRKSREFAQSVELKDEKDFHILSQVINVLLSLDLILKDKKRILAIESIEKIQFLEVIESSYEEILEELEFLLYYSSFPYVDFEKALILSIKEAIKNLKNHILKYIHRKK